MGLLEVDRASKAWERPVLRAVSLNVPPGTTAFVEGANGSGKTTLLRLIAGLLEPDAGEIRFGGRATTGPGRRDFQRRLGLVSAADRGLYARLDARANLSLCARLALVPRDAVRQLVEAAIERLELRAFADRRVDRLSTGQRQRLRLAAAFVHAPELVLLDEPAASLDEHGLALLEAELERHTAAHGSALWFGPTGSSAPQAAGPRLTLSDGTLTPA